MFKLGSIIWNSSEGTIFRPIIVAVVLFLLSLVGGVVWLAVAAPEIEISMLLVEIWAVSVVSLTALYVALRSPRLGNEAKFWLIVAILIAGSWLVMMNYYSLLEGGALLVGCSVIIALIQTFRFQRVTIKTKVWIVVIIMILQTALALAVFVTIGWAINLLVAFVLFLPFWEYRDKVGGAISSMGTSFGNWWAGLSGKAQTILVALVIYLIMIPVVTIFAGLLIAVLLSVISILFIMFLVVVTRSWRNSPKVFLGFWLIVAMLFLGYLVLGVATDHTVGETVTILMKTLGYAPAPVERASVRSHSNGIGTYLGAYWGFGIVLILLCFVILMFKGFKLSNTIADDILLGLGLPPLTRLIALAFFATRDIDAQTATFWWGVIASVIFSLMGASGWPKWAKFFPVIAIILTAIMWFMNLMPA